MHYLSLSWALALAALASAARLPSEELASLAPASREAEIHQRFTAKLAGVRDSLQNATESLAAVESLSPAAGSREAAADSLVPVALRQFTEGLETLRSVRAAVSAEQLAPAVKTQVLWDLDR